MEIFELKYFLAVAQTENVNRASGQINVSAGSLSKAIQRLEDELQTPLFYKSGRGIRLTPEGVLLKSKATQILQLEEDVRLQLQGQEQGSLNVYISSVEVLQTFYGIKILQTIQKNYPQAHTRFLIRSEEEAIAQVMQGEVQLALVTLEPGPDLAVKVLGRVEFKTFVSKSHPLVRKYGSKAVPIDELLKHSFVCPDASVLGRISKSSSPDGWRDDKFPRRIKYRVCGLKLMEGLIEEGLAIGYLPSYFFNGPNFVPLTISGCNFSCHQTIRIVAKDPTALGWLSKLWDQIRAD